MLIGYHRVKRLLDVAGAMLGLAICALPMLLIALAIRMRLGSPVFYRQQRPGLHGQPFTLLKFRTMTDARGADGHLLPDAERLTRLGRFLRRTSLDELPELINVLRGEMSLVGPRPLLTEYLPYYTEREHLRHSVKPGITGWAQINGRNLARWDERLAMDVWYVEHCSLRLDIQIIIRTVVSILKRENVVVDPRSLMPDLDQERMAGRNA